MTTAALQKWGNSQGFRLPKQLLQALNWKVNDEFTLLMQEGKLIIEPAYPKKRKTMKELFANFQGEYTHEEIDWGQPVGKEVW